MGYTNYWHQHNDFTDEQWKSIKEEYDYIKEVCKDIIVDETTKTNEIVFNGIGEQSHETFVLKPETRTYNDKRRYEGEDIYFHFCKTAMKPYDLAVWYMLTQVQRIAQDLSISRDYP